MWLKHRLETRPETLYTRVVTRQEELGRIATVSYRNDLAIVSLICNVKRTSNILENVFDVLDSCGINVVMMSQVRPAAGAVGTHSPPAL